MIRNGHFSRKMGRMGNSAAFAYVRKSNEIVPTKAKRLKEEEFIKKSVLNRALSACKKLPELEPKASASPASPKRAKIAQVHPCTFQRSGGCHSARCPFVHLPSDLCLQQLTTGSCEKNKEGNCPWRHDVVEKQFMEREPTPAELLGMKKVLQCIADVVADKKLELPNQTFAIAFGEENDMFQIRKTDGTLRVERTLLLCCLSASECGEDLTEAQITLDGMKQSFAFLLWENSPNEFLLSSSVTSYYETLWREECSPPPHDFQVSLRDIVCYQVVRQLTHAKCTTDLRCLVQGLLFLAKSPADYSSAECSNHVFSSLFLCISLCNEPRLHTKPLTHELLPQTSNCASRLQKELGEHFRFWIGVLNRLFYRCHEQRALTDEIFRSLHTTLNVVAADVEEYFKHSFLRTFVAFSELTDENMFVFSSSIATSQQTFVTRNLFPAQFVITTTCLNEWFKIAGQCLLSVDDRSLDSLVNNVAHFTVMDSKARRLLALSNRMLDAIMSALMEEGNKIKKRRHDLEVMFERKHDVWQAQKLQKTASSVHGEKSRKNVPAHRQELRRGDGSVSLMDEVFPQGAACAFPATTRILLRQLFCGGKPFKCLKTISSILKTNHLLRQIAGSAGGELVQKQRHVMYRAVHKKTAKSVLKRKSIDVPRFVIPHESRELRNRLRAQVNNIAFYLAVDDTVVADMMIIINGAANAQPGVMPLRQQMWERVSKGLCDFASRCIPTISSEGDCEGAFKFLQMLCCGEMSPQGVLNRVGMTPKLLEAAICRVDARSAFEYVTPLFLTRVSVLMRSSQNVLIDGHLLFVLFEQYALVDPLRGWTALFHQDFMAIRNSLAHVAVQHARHVNDLTGVRRLLSPAAADDTHVEEDEEGEEKRNRSRADTSVVVHKSFVHPLSNTLSLQLPSQNRTTDVWKILACCGFLRGLGPREILTLCTSIDKKELPLLQSALLLAYKQEEKPHHEMLGLVLLSFLTSPIFANVGCDTLEVEKSPWTPTRYSAPSKLRIRNVDEVIRVLAALLQCDPQSFSGAEAALLQPVLNDVALVKTLVSLQRKITPWMEEHLARHLSVDDRGVLQRHFRSKLS